MYHSPRFLFFVCKIVHATQGARCFFIIISIPPQKRTESFSIPLAFALKHLTCYHNCVKVQITSLQILFV